MTVRLPDDHWGARSISCYEKVEQIGEGTYGQVCCSAVSGFASRSWHLVLCIHNLTYYRSHDGRSPLMPPAYSGVQGKEQGDERYRGSQEDSGAQREFWGKFPCELELPLPLCKPPLLAYNVTNTGWV